MSAQPSSASRAHCGGARRRDAPHDGPCGRCDHRRDEAALTESEEAVRWGFVVGMRASAALLLLCSLVGVTGKLQISRLVIGADNRVSTSKTVFSFTWTIVVAAGLVALVYAT